MWFQARRRLLAGGVKSALAMRVFSCEGEWAKSLGCHQAPEHLGEIQVGFSVLRQFRGLHQRLSGRTGLEKRMATFPQRLMAYAISGADKQHPFAHPWLVMGPGNLLAGAAPQGVHRMRFAPVPASTGTGGQATVIKITGGCLLYTSPSPRDS